MNRPQLQKVIGGMQKAGLKQLLVTSPMSIRYLTGRYTYPGERLIALLITDDGGATLVANALFAMKAPEGARLVEYDDTQPASEALSACVKPGVLGVDKDFTCRFALPLMESRPDVRLRLGSGCVDRARMIKTEEELKCMAESSRKNDEALARTMERLRPGMTENEVAGLYRQAAKDLGAQGESFDALICFGPNCAEPHHATDDTISRPGDSAILDVGLIYAGYCSDMTRTAFLTGATDEQKRVYDAVKRANAAGRAAVRPGVKLRDVDRAARAVIEEAGYGRYFIHRTGHGIGLEVHEFPDVSQTSEEVCTPGMVFSVEPGVYLPGRFGVRVEDLVAVTPEGGVTLNALARDERII